MTVEGGKLNLTGGKGGDGGNSGTGMSSKTGGCAGTGGDGIFVDSTAVLTVSGGKLNLTGGQGGTGGTGSNSVDGAGGKGGPTSSLQRTGYGIYAFYGTVIVNGGSLKAVAGSKGTPGTGGTGTTSKGADGGDTVRYVGGVFCIDITVADNVVVKAGSSNPPTGDPLDHDDNLFETLITSPYVTMVGPHVHDKGKENEITFETAITTEAELRELFTNGGSGYLDNDIKLTKATENSHTITVSSEKLVRLCLNGNKIDLNGDEKNNCHIFVEFNATFELYDCDDTGTVCNGYADHGGAIHANGTFNMYGGTIKNCTAYNVGGGVAIQSTFNMYGGTITNCVGGNGGGVDCSDGTFHMYGGSITGNTAKKLVDWTSEGNGGGVYNHRSGFSFHMHGGSITGNTAQNYGGGVFNLLDISFDGKCTVKDNYSYHGDMTNEAAKQRDNVFTGVPFGIGYTDYNTDPAKVYGTALSEGSQIWITLAEYSDYKMGEVGVPGDVTINAAESDTQYFYSDVDAYYAVFVDAPEEGEEGYDANVQDHVELVSRITQQPKKDNSYAVGVNTDGLALAGYTDFAKEIKYQWYLRKEVSKTVKEADSSVNYGTLDEEKNSVECDKSYMVSMSVPKNALRVTFSCTNENLVSYDDYGTLTRDGTKYTLELTQGGDGFFVKDPNGAAAFTITDVKIVCLSGEKINDTDATLNNGAVKDSTYFCTVTFKDGSSVDSNDTVYDTHSHEWTYTVVGSTVTAECTEECDYEGEDLTLTISYNKTTGEAELSAATFCGEDVPTVYYVGTGETSYDKSEDAPTAIGSYKAYITVGEDENETEVSVAFTVAPAGPVCVGDKVVKFNELLPGHYTMFINDVNTGVYDFDMVVGGYTIRKEGTNEYVCFDNGRIVMKKTDDPTAWAKDDAAFHYTVLEVTRYWLFGWRTKTNVTEYYLNADANGNLTTSKLPGITHFAFHIELDHHCYAYTFNGDGKHTGVCTVCGNVCVEACDYSEHEHCPKCGSFDVSKAGVKNVEVSVDKTEVGGGLKFVGWKLVYVKPYTSYTAHIYAYAEGTTVAKVEYSIDGEHYTDGSVYTSLSCICKLWIKVTDANGKETYWLYENCKVTQIVEDGEEYEITVNDTQDNIDSHNIPSTIKADESVDITMKLLNLDCGVSINVGEECTFTLENGVDNKNNGYLDVTNVVIDGSDVSFTVSNVTTDFTITVATVPC